MSNSVSLVLLCEDRRHEQFVTAFLRAKKRRITRLSFPSAYKSHEKGGAKRSNAFVLSKATEEIGAARKVPPKRALILIIDGDNRGYASRCGEIAARLKAEDMAQLTDKERIALIVPCRNIETWVHHFAGEIADETTNYKDLYRNAETLPQARAFADWVSDGNVEEVADLPALNAAREELRRLHDLMRE